MPRPPRPDTGSHAGHDRLAVAALAAGDLSGADQIEASALVESCEACAILGSELRALAVATRDLPPPVRGTARDFRISPERAASLARGALWRRLLRPFGRQGNATIRPLAAMFSTLGVAGLLLAALPLLPLVGGSASVGAGDGTAYVREAPAAPAAASQDPKTRALPSPTIQPLTDELAGDAEAGSVAEPTDLEAGGTLQAPEATEPTEPPVAAEGPALGRPLVSVSLLFLGAGLGLFILRRAATRLR